MVKRLSLYECWPSLSPGQPPPGLNVKVKGSNTRAGQELALGYVLAGAARLCIGNIMILSHQYSLSGVKGM